MKRLFHTSAAALALSLAAATTGIADTSQLAASAGIDASEAASLTLTEIAQMKFNADTRRDDRQAVVRSEVTGSDAAARSQLAASAGLSADEAEGMTLTEIFVAKRNLGPRRDESQVMVSARNAPTAGQAGRSQLIASAGIDPEVARGMTLTEIFVAKINHEGDNESRQGLY